MKVKEISQLINGEYSGDGDKEIKGAAKIESAGTDEISFISNPLYEKYFSTAKAGAVIISKSLKNKFQRDDISIIYTDDAYLSFVKVLEIFSPAKEINIGISPNAKISKNAKLGNDIFIDDFVVIKSGVSIGNNTLINANCVIGKGVQIGEGCLLESGVIIYKGCIIGNNVIIHSGTVIGSDGFGFARNDDGSFKKIIQTGIVRIGDDVEIGSNCSIDRATLGETVLMRGVKLDNQIQIAHNVFIDEDTVIISQVGIAGSTKIGKRCMIGGQSGLVGHITICDDVIIGASVGVSKSITKPGTYLGYRAKPMRESLKEDSNIKGLQELKDKIKKLELTIEDLKKEKNK